MRAITEATLYRDAGDVKRYHTKRTIREQTVGQHTFGILMLLRQVSPDCSKALLFTAMHHDLAELFTGDIPAPMKRANAQLSILLDEVECCLAPLYKDFGINAEEARLLKWADRMELVLWCLEEVRLGNDYCRETASRGLGWVIQSGVPACAQQLTMEVVDAAHNLDVFPQSGADLEKNA